MFSRSQIRLLRILMRPMSLSEIAKALGLSISRTSELIIDLEEKKFVKHVGRKVYWTDYTYAQSLREVIFSNPALHFEDFLYGKRMGVLLSLAIFGGDLDYVSDRVNTTDSYALKMLYELQKRGLVYKSKNIWYFNKKMWPKFSKFLGEYGTKKLIIMPIKDNSFGTLTGFSVYPEYGVLVYPKTYLYLIEKKKLSKEEVFVHSLYQVHDARTRKLAKEFFEKNKLDIHLIKRLAKEFLLVKELGEVLG